MAERKETPKKVYPKSAIDSGCKCRLCGGIFEKARCKNIFKKGNEGRLRSAEIVKGGALICEEGFPHLLCRACDRRLENFEKFRKVVRDVQNGLTREKRYTVVSPSAPVSRAKSLRSHNLDARPVVACPLVPVESRAILVCRSQRLIQQVSHPR